MNITRSVRHVYSLEKSTSVGNFTPSQVVGKEARMQGRKASLGTRKITKSAAWYFIRNVLLGKREEGEDVEIRERVELSPLNAKMSWGEEGEIKSPSPK